MDLFQIVRVIEDLLYEMMSWLVFYPRTLWRILTRPRAMTDYSHAEEQAATADRYQAALSPPLLLMLTILAAHAADLARGERMESATAIGQLLLSGANPLFLRAVLFATLPLVIALVDLVVRRVPLDRQSLRPPFFAQCYLVAPFALLSSVATTVSQLAMPHAPTVAGVLQVGITLWYVWAQAVWFGARLPLGRAGAAGVALLAVALAAAAWIGASFLVASLF